MKIAMKIGEGTDRSVLMMAWGRNRARHRGFLAFKLGLDLSFDLFPGLLDRRCHHVLGQIERGWQLRQNLVFAHKFAMADSVEAVGSRT
jgi:hypothetical protein